MSPSPAPASAELSRLQQFSLAILGIALTVLGLYILQGFVRALLWAAIFAIALRPFYARAERRWPPGHHNILLPLVFTLGVALIFLVPLIVGGVALGSESAALFHTLLEYQRTGVPVPGVVAHLPFARQALGEWWQANLSDPANMQTLLGHINRGQVMAVSETYGGKILHMAVSSGFTMMALFFLFRDGGSIGRHLHRAATRAFGHHGGTVAAQLAASVHGTVDGLVLVGIGEGILIGIAYWVAGVLHPAVFGAATAVAAMVPFGAPVVFGAAALVLAAQGSVAAAVTVLVFGFLVGFVADHFIRPVLIGGATKLPFVWVLLGILGGVETFGLIGLFVGPAVMSALILLWREWAGEPIPVP
jgi:predicted PurR-regulated permease PerM